MPIRCAASRSVIAVSGGVAKARAILAGLRGRYCNCLITDASAAQMVLELARNTPAPANGVENRPAPALRQVATVGV